MNVYKPLVMIYFICIISANHFVILIAFACVSSLCKHSIAQKVLNEF